MESNHTAPDITTGFIQMVEAYKVKPELEAKINELEHIVEDANAGLNNYYARVQELESRLAAAQEDKARLTRERDDAMFRSLELEEKTKSVSDLVAKLETLVRPEPVAKAEAPVEQPVANMDVEQRDVSGETKKPDWSDWPAHQDIVRDNQGNVEDFRPAYSGQAAVQGQSEGSREGMGEGKPNTPNWDSPTKNEQNADSHATETVASPDVSQHSSGPDYTEPQRHENHGKPYHDKPWWVNDNDWRSQGGQGPHEGGSWQAPWEQRA